jgi:hypothetical protein
VADDLNNGAATTLTCKLAAHLVCLLLWLQKEAVGEITESTPASDRGRKGGTLQPVRLPRIKDDDAPSLIRPKQRPLNDRPKPLNAR